MLPLEKQVTELMKKGTFHFLIQLYVIVCHVAMILPFDRVCTLLGRGKNERGAILDDLQKCALLVQGCWVVHSALLLSKESAHLRSARDFIVSYKIYGTVFLFLFSKSFIFCITYISFGASLNIIYSLVKTLLLHLKQVLAYIEPLEIYVKQITSAQLRDILHPIAVLRTGGGWEFRHAPDTEFMNKLVL